MRQSPTIACIKLIGRMTRIGYMTRIEWMTLIGCVLLSCSALAEPPASQPAAVKLLGGRIEFTPPAGWTAQTPKSGASDRIAIFLAADHDGFFDVQVLPTNASITPKAGKAMIGALLKGHKNRHQEVVENPTLVEDGRVAIHIHERYKNSQGVVVDESHLFRQVGGRAVEVDVQSASDDKDHVAAVQKAAEDALVSAKWVRPKRV